MNEQPELEIIDETDQFVGLPEDPTEHPNRFTGSKRSQAKINKEFRSFKKKLHRLVDKTKIMWNGEPWKRDSEYYFIVHNDLIALMAMISNNVLDETVANQIIDQAEEVKKAIEKESE